MATLLTTVVFCDRATRHSSQVATRDADLDEQVEAASESATAAGHHDGVPVRIRVNGQA